MNDVTETIFLRLLRGTGIDGLSGLKQSRVLGKGRLIRPFLEVSKKEIEDYAKKNHVNYIFDETNKDNEHDRNFLRNEIFPQLDERWNDFSSRVFKMSKITNDRNNNFVELLNYNYGDLINNVIKIKDLENLNTNITKEIIRASIRNENISIPNSKVLNEIIKTFIFSNPSSKSIVSWSRADKDQQAGKITYKEGNIIISTHE
jgi:tRNA(Ile)-lysidine synthase